MTKIVINSCYGGFSLSREALEALASEKGVVLYWRRIDRLTDVAYTSSTFEDETYFSNRLHDRSDPDLVAVVEALGNAANGRHAELRVIEIPDGVEWQIEEYDGREWVAEKHRTWR